MLKAYPELPPSQKTSPNPLQMKKKRSFVKIKRVAKMKSDKIRGVKTKRIAKRKNGKYMHSQDKSIALFAKVGEAKLREEELIRKTADCLRKVLPDYIAEHQPKNVVHESDTPMEIPVPLTPKRDSGDDDDDDNDDVKIIDVRESGKTSHFCDKLYGIRKEGDTLMIGNSAVDLDEPGVIAVKGKRFKLTRGL
jgi:hypothetical protein